MALAILVDMIMSPDWVDVLESHGWSCQHWSSIGAPTALDPELMSWARDNDHVVLTHDLDFGALLALTHARGPSVIQVRTQDVLPDHLARLVVAALREFAGLLETGALISIDEERSRVRILPIR